MLAVTANRFLKLILSLLLLLLLLLLQTRLTLTLISIVCLAVVCILPAAFGDVVVMSYVFSGSDTLRQFLHSPFYKVFRSVSNMLLVCNMSLNFFLYSAFNDKFLRVLKKMVHR